MSNAVISQANSEGQINLMSNAVIKDTFGQLGEV